MYTWFLVRDMILIKVILRGCMIVFGGTKCIPHDRMTSNKLFLLFSNIVAFHVPYEDRDITVEVKMNILCIRS